MVSSNLLASAAFKSSPLRYLIASTKKRQSISSQVRALHSLQRRPTLPLFSIQTAFRQPTCLQTQVRSAWGSTSQNILAHAEQTANNNPSSATAQNSFYAVLLRANMPAIVVERYSTGRYASNSTSNTLYQTALEKLGQTTGGVQSQLQQNGSGLSQEQIRSIGMAMATGQNGKNIASISPRGPEGNGSKTEPLYVVVDESWAAYIFKWVKFIASYGLMVWIALVFVMFAVELSSLKTRSFGSLGGGGSPTQAKAEQQKTKFSDVHGCEEAKEELQELVEFLKDPTKFATLGGKLPKGVLLIGPPGTGKTLLARAVAGEAGVPFFFMSGSEFDEMYVGIGAKRIRELFAAARAKAPAIIFIDELDAVGGKRKERDQAYAKQTLNQLLVEMDGFSQDTGVIVMAATNFPQSLDKALMRPGRFDRHVNVPLPDVRGRAAILTHHMKKIKAEADVDATSIARMTPGFSGADLENLVNQAAVHASRAKKTAVSLKDLDWAKDKILMGAERRSAIIRDKDKIMTAYHEGGHAVVAMFTDGADPVYKATIMPRGMALGITFLLPEMDRVSQSKKEMLAAIDVAMGGKMAEEIIYGAENTTSGASGDITNATKIAYAMVTQYGFSQSLGDVDLLSNYDSLSSDTKQRIEDEVKQIIEDSRQRATKLLTSRRKDLEIIADALVRYEVLDLDEMRQVLKGEKLDKLMASEGIPIKVPEMKYPTRVEGMGESGSATRSSGNPPGSPSGGVTM